MLSTARSTGRNTRTPDDDERYVLTIAGMPPKCDWQELKDFVRKTLGIRVRWVEVYPQNIEGVRYGTFDVKGTKNAYRCFDTLESSGYNNHPVDVGLLQGDRSECVLLKRSIKPKHTVRSVDPIRSRLPLSQTAIPIPLQQFIARRVDLDFSRARAYSISYPSENIPIQTPYSPMTSTMYPMVSNMIQAPPQPVIWNSTPLLTSHHFSDGRSFDSSRPHQRNHYASTTPRIINRAPATIPNGPSQSRPPHLQTVRRQGGGSGSYQSPGVPLMQATIKSTSPAQQAPQSEHMRRREQVSRSRHSTTSARQAGNPALNHHPRPQAPEFVPNSITEPPNGPLICDGSANRSKRSRYVADSDEEDSA